MRNSLSLKMLLRSPLRTLLTLLLLAAVSFGLLSRVCEYAVIQREMDRAMSYYQGVAALDTGVPNTSNLSRRSQIKDNYSWEGLGSNTRPPALTQEQISSIASLSQVTSLDTRYMTSGISHSYERINKYAMYGDEYNYNARFVMEATFEDYIVDNWNSEVLNMRFSDYRMFAGPEKLSREGKSFIIKSDIIDGRMTGWTSSDITEYIIQNNPFGLKFVESLVPGSRYLLIGRFNDINLKYFWLGDFDTIDDCPSFWELDGKSENYLQTEEFAPVRELIEITNKDYYTHDIVYTSNMLSIPRFAQEKMVVSEGLALTTEDDGSLHCVVSFAFLKKNQLNVGDTITMDLGSKLLEQHSSMGAVGTIPMRYSSSFKTVELEIVGAYIDTDTSYERSANMYWGYSPNTIFVPSSLLPTEVPQDHKIKPGEFSLVIENAKNMEPFLEAAEPLAKELGIELVFSDGGWFQVNQNIKVSAQASLITVAVFIVASVMAIWLVVYLFIGRNRQQYAIMRALGTPRKAARRTLLLSLGVSATVAIPIGGAAGIYFVLRSVSSTLTDLAAEVTARYVPDTSLPVGVVVACFITQVVLLALITVIFLIQLDKVPPLVLLQGETKATKKSRKANDEGVPTQVETVTLPVTESNIETSKTSMKTAFIPSNKKKYGAWRQVCSYISRHLRRTKFKTALSLLIALLLPATMGLFTMTLHSYKELSKGIEVKSYMADIASDLVAQSSTSDLVGTSYYRHEIDVYVNRQVYSPGTMVITNDIDRSLRTGGVEEYSVDYGDGYTWNGVAEDEAWCLIGEEVASMYGILPGDELTLLGGDLLQRLWL